MGRLNDDTQMPFESAMALVPTEWTAWELRTRRCKTRFVFTMSKLPIDDDSSIDDESEPGHGSTPTEAVLDALSKLKGPSHE